MGTNWLWREIVADIYRQRDLKVSKQANLKVSWSVIFVERKGYLDTALGSSPAGRLARTHAFETMW